MRWALFIFVLPSISLLRTALRRTYLVFHYGFKFHLACLMLLAYTGRVLGLLPTSAMWRVAALYQALLRANRRCISSGCWLFTT